MSNSSGSMTSIRTFTTLLVVGGILYLGYLILQPFFIVIATSIIITVFISPLYTALLPWVKYQSLSAIISLLIFTVAVIIPLTVIVSAAVSETTTLIRFIQEKPDFIGDLQKSIMSPLEEYGYTFELDEIDFREDLMGVVRGFSSNLGSLLARTGSLLVRILFVYLTTFFLLINKRFLRTFFTNIQIVPARHVKRIEERSKELINGIVRGSLIVLVLQILVSTTVFSIFGLPAPVLLGFIYGILALLPAIGPSILWIPLSIIMFITGEPLSAFFFALVLFASNIAIDNFLGPRIIGSQTKLHQIIIMFSVFGGIRVFGLLGIVMGPTIIALCMVALEMYKELLLTDNKHTVLSDTEEKDLKA